MFGNARRANIPTEGFGASPDGLGYAAPYEPSDVSPEAGFRSAGITTLALTVVGGLGIALGGWKGGVAGVLFTGGALNIYRAQKWWGSPDPGEKHEAVTSAVMGAMTLGLSVFTTYKAYQGRKEDAE